VRRTLAKTGQVNQRGARRVLSELAQALND
jgi:hypothetical protein